MWQELLRAKDRFVALDSGLFLDEQVTSREYVLRYAPDVVRDLADLLRLTGTQDLDEVGDVVFAQADFDGDLHELPEGVELYAGGVGHVVEYPFRWEELLGRAVEAQEEARADED